MWTEVAMQVVAAMGEEVEEGAVMVLVEEVMVEAATELEEEVTAEVEEVMALEEEATAVEEEVMVVEDMVEVMNLSYRNFYSFVKINIYMLWAQLL